MPKIFEYLGIIIRFYSNEHEPIHIHAIYGKSIMKVSFYIKNGEISKVTYQDVTNDFPPSQKKKLKSFIIVYKLEIVKLWDRYFIWKEKVPFEKITKEI